MLKPFTICVLISGGGTTLKNLLDHVDTGQAEYQIVRVIASKPTADGLAFAAQAGIDAEVIDHREFQTMEDFSDSIFDSIRLSGADLVVMGGFLRRVLIPDDFQNKIVNIHPSLIPAFCGKGNYGRHVHQAVLDYGCKITGCTVHYVDDQYDHGPIIAQSAVAVHDDDSVGTLAGRVFQAECELFPRVINAIATGKVSVTQRNVSWSSDEP